MLHLHGRVVPVMFHALQGRVKAIVAYTSKRRVWTTATNHKYVY